MQSKLLYPTFMRCFKSFWSIPICLTQNSLMNSLNWESQHSYKIQNCPLILWVFIW